MNLYASLEKVFFTVIGKILLVTFAMVIGSFSAFFSIQFSFAFHVEIYSIFTTKKRELLPCNLNIFCVQLPIFLLAIKTVVKWDLFTFLEHFFHVNFIWKLSSFSLWKNYAFERLAEFYFDIYLVSIFSAFSRSEW